MKRVALLLFALAAACQRTETKTASAPSPAPAPALTHTQEIEKWRLNRIKRLQAEDGWLTLVGLHWLKEGENPLVLSPNAPPNPGTLTLKDGKVTLNPSAAMMIDDTPVSGSVQLLDDSEEKGPTIVKVGPVRFQIIKRGQRYGLRVKDANAETRTHFAGIDTYPVDPKWRVEAKLEKYEPVKKMPITDITGMTADQIAPGALVFTIDGKEYRLDPIAEDDQLFIIFRDETSKDATYPAGRYLYAAAPGPDGKVIVDFNKAYNPPCAFTPFATCPLPPLQNRLAVRVEAGEKNFKAPGHA